MAKFKNGDVCRVTKIGNDYMGQRRLVVGDIVTVLEDDSSCPWVQRRGHSDTKHEIACGEGCLELAVEPATLVPMTTEEGRLLQPGPEVFVLVRDGVHPRDAGERNYEDRYEDNAEFVLSSQDGSTCPYFEQVFPQGSSRGTQCIYWTNLARKIETPAQDPRAAKLVEVIKTRLTSIAGYDARHTDTYAQNSRTVLQAMLYDAGYHVETVQAVPAVAAIPASVTIS
ncbi:hypothetical protein [Roseomonas sp. WA12]